MPTPKMPLPTQILWERACSRRGRYIRQIFSGSNTVFVSKVERHPGHSHKCIVCRGVAAHLKDGLCSIMTTRDVSVAAKSVGASLLAKAPVHSPNLQRLKHGLREQGGAPPRSLPQVHRLPRSSSASERWAVTNHDHQRCISR